MSSLHKHSCPGCGISYFCDEADMDSAGLMKQCSRCAPGVKIEKEQPPYVELSR